MLKLIKGKRRKRNDDVFSPSGEIHVALCGVNPDFFLFLTDWQKEKEYWIVRMSYWHDGLEFAAALENRKARADLILVYAPYGQGLFPVTCTDLSGKAYPVRLLSNPIDVPTRTELKLLLDEIYFEKLPNEQRKMKP